MISFYHFFLAFFGALWYRFPSRHLTVIGVTGTKGKSTTVELLRSIFEEAGKRVALSSSRHMVISGREFPKRDTMTMPGRFELQRFLRRAVTTKCDYAIIEVTSQGVLQHRHRFINFGAAVFLNIHPEHIEAHGSFEKYLQAKLSFFKYAAKTGTDPVFFVNSRDLHSADFIQAAGNHPTTQFSKDDFLRDFLHGDRTKAGVWLGRADFLLENAAAASAVTLHGGVSKTIIEKALREFQGISGRLEYVEEKPFAVVIDYALTPDSLEALYKNLSEKKGSGRLIAVFGSAGGGRDVWKRKRLGEIADRYCEKIVLTSDDFYDEDPMKIISDIAAGISSSEKILKIVDRKEAIQAAVKLAKPGDTVVITGMGDQKWLHAAKGKMILWDERAVVEEALRAVHQ